jgi:hypothetical protein
MTKNIKVVMEDGQALYEEGVCKEIVASEIKVVLKNITLHIKNDDTIFVENNKKESIVS